MLTAVGALLAAFAFPADSFADNTSGCDFAASGTTQSCSGPLAGSTFAGGDGNLQASPTAFGSTDWSNVPGRNTGIDLASGPGDNSFGQGTKEDNASVTVVNGSIPPNKSDLTRFYEASETGSNSHNLLYLAWERTNVLGSANMDFEINQATTPSLGAPGPHLINRTAGDLLVTFDFTNGGGKPTLSLQFWLTSGSTTQCFASNSFPCWGDHVTLNGSNSIGAVNNLDPVTDLINPTGGNACPGTTPTCAALTFGETAIDLTAANVFPSGTCKAFGSVFLKSRASASFGSEVKDFVAPVPVNISNCGQIIIRKVTQPSPDPTDSTFNYTTTGGLTPPTFVLKNGQKQDYGSTVPVGSYSVTETDPTSLHFAFLSLDCNASNNSNGSSEVISGRTVNIILKADDVVDCTYTNVLQLGAIKITKTSSKTAATPLQGAMFSITGPNSFSDSVTTLADGTVCVGHLVFGTYSVQETAAPPGYKIDDTTAHIVTVNATSTCGDGNEATFSATDTPLTDLTITVTSEAANGTISTITCVAGTAGGGGGNIGTSPQTGSTATVTAGPGVTALTPGTYTCTVLIDP